jgi:hypothetical protein
MNLPATFRRIATYFRLVKPKPAEPAPVVQMPPYYVVQIFPNQFCFELDITTGKCEIIRLRHLEGSKYMLVPKANCMYEIAINKRNAERKFVKKLELINNGFSKQ